MPVQNPVVVIPGITASSLRDSYPVSPQTVWSVLRHDELRVALHPDDLRFELLEPARIEADAIFREIYGDLVQELRTELSPPNRPTPVYPFAYDWRLPLALLAERLETFIDEVIARTALLRHYHRGGYGDDPRVDLVAHSMGGLLVAGYLARTGNRARVGKVVTIATPFRGSLEAPIKIVTGTAELGEADPNPRDRFGARLTPALYHLVPEYPGAVSATPPIPASLFDADAWQPSVIRSIADAIQQRGREPGSTAAARTREARALLEAMLQEARAFRRTTERLDLADSGMSVDRWLCLVGVDDVTRVHLPIRDDNGRPMLYLRSVDRVNRWSEPDDERRVQTGDGTVPFAGARAAFIPLESIVCLRPRDFGYWELRDRAIRQLAGFHASLPTMNLVHRLAAAFLLGDARRKGIGGWRAPGVSAAEWRPPIPGLADRSLQ